MCDERRNEQEEQQENGGAGDQSCSHLVKRILARQRRGRISEEDNGEGETAVVPVTAECYGVEQNGELISTTGELISTTGGKSTVPVPSRLLDLVYGENQAPAVPLISDKRKTLLQTLSLDSLGSTEGATVPRRDSTDTRVLREFSGELDNEFMSSSDDDTIEEEEGPEEDEVVTPTSSDSEVITPTSPNSEITPPGNSVSEIVRSLEAYGFLQKIDEEDDVEGGIDSEDTASTISSASANGVSVFWGRNEIERSTSLTSNDRLKWGK
eukprot:sb/3468226/